MGATASSPINAAAEPPTYSEKATSPAPTIVASRSGPAPTAALTNSSLKAWEHQFKNNPKALLAQTILDHTDLSTALFRRDATIENPHIFNTRLSHDSKIVTNQKSSGRCWLFATTNVCRLNVSKELKLGDEFELSQSYLFFYDKLNKSNYFLESSIELANEPLDGRTLSFLNVAPINDGGQADMSAGLLEKYGMVPKALYPESFSSSASSKLNSLLTSYLRQSALGLRKMIASGAKLDDVRAQKEVYMAHVWKVLAITLGTPPSPDEKFTWDYYTKDGKDGQLSMTPVEFAAKFAGPYPFVDSFSLIHDPRNEFGKLYTVDRLGNIWGGRPVSYVNTELSRLKKAVIASIKANQACFFGCDVGARSARTGEMALSTFDYNLSLDLDYTMTKAERLQTSDSAMTHAMVITAVHLDKDGKPVRYRVENSWGSDNVGDKGFMVMTDAWFDEYVYQVVVHKSLVDKDLVKVLDQKPTVLPCWDPLGALA